MPSPTITTRKWLLRTWKFLAVLFIGMFLLSYALADSGWRALSKGLEYQEINQGYVNPWSHIHAFRINLTSHDLALVMAKELDSKHASAEAYAEHSKALITINGGFFDHDYQALGLRINHKQQKNPLKKISWWGVFYIKNNQAHLASAAHFKPDPHIEFAIQSGPRLLINGQIPSLKPGRRERSALGITKDGDVIILITDNAPLSTTELAERMKAPPLNCLNALNLDGGSSSQLQAHIQSFRLNVHGFSNVSDAVIVTEKK